MNTRSFHTVLAVAALVFTQGLSTRGTAIYSESFTGNAANPLNDTAPDEAPGAETWNAASGWTETGVAPFSSGGTGNAFLPFTPDTGKLYTLTASLNPDDGTVTHWMALGFTASNNTGIDFWSGANNAAPWVLLRENPAASNVIRTGAGPGLDVGGNFDLDPDVAGPVELTITLNTLFANWSVAWFADGAFLASHTYATNPTITHVGFGTQIGSSSVTIGGTVADFGLSSVIPEPSCLALLGLGMVSTFLFRRGLASSR